MKTFADHCLELANKATEGPWEAQIPGMTGQWPTARIKPLKIQGRLYSSPMIKTEDAEFIAASRTLVPELVRRLKRACEELRVTGITLRRHGQYDEATMNCKLADELEQPLEEK